MSAVAPLSAVPVLVVPRLPVRLGTGAAVSHAGALMIRALLISMIVLAAGCAAPSALRTEWEHTSHPFAGPPFGRRTDEDSLNTVNVLAHWERGRFYSDVGLGYSLADGGFYGPKLTFTSRVGVNLWSRR